MDRRVHVDLHHLAGAVEVVSPAVLRDVRKPWESEDAAFRWLLGVLAVCAVIVLLSLALKALL